MLVLASGGGPAIWAKDKTPDHPPLNLSIDTTPIDRDAVETVSYASVVKKASPSIVYIKSSKKVKTQIPQFFNDPMFRHFFGNPGQGGGIPQSRLEESLGSGIIVSPDGYIVTNNHVVEGADEIQVTFGKPEREFKATVIGRDKDADIAILKIDATSLPAATLGDSDQLQVGDEVLAIGNPFDVGLTVTHGIVSALGRSNMDIEKLEDFIQTDAPINPGNSGGALLDSKGRVVGINTAIASSNGGSNGVGFAIPIDIVRTVMNQLVSTGKVARGFVGVQLEEIKPDVAEQLGVTTHGVLVADVTADSPAEKAGLKNGDVITKLDGKPVDDTHLFQMAVSEMAPGTSVSLEYIRDGKTATVSLKLGDRSSLTADDDSVGSENKDEGVLNGVTVGDITSDIRDQLEIPAEIKGAVITDVDPDSASAKAGLAKGDVILDLDRRPVHNADEAVKLSADIKGPKVLVRLFRSGSYSFVVVDESAK